MRRGFLKNATERLSNLLYLASLRSPLSGSVLKLRVFVLKYENLKNENEKFSRESQKSQV